ncbi:MAG: DNA methyltransferase [Candidatus Cloacimonetes bacterium HGW-Cloacimonetes-3]|jgi:methylated-DNA-protein-cysteine methyltransferase-like protein|nr:MAG: DNA methyltransferase [Candidatus Cloacimonetes bacterium HGW-Cloacimonetes-3]
MSEFTVAVIQIILAIPCGKVAGYGQIATMAGNPGGARAVARVLHSCTEKHSLPWWRVIRNSGEIALPEDGGGALQKELLLVEGVVFKSKSKVDLKQCAWDA